MKEVLSMRIKDAHITVWESEKGEIILGGLGWYEFYDYEEMLKEEK